MTFHADTFKFVPVIYRVISASLALACGVIVLSQRLGSSIMRCSEGCSQASSVWYSNGLLMALLAGSIGAILLQFTGGELLRRRFCWGLGVAACFSGALMGLGHFFCPLCFVAQLCWIALALEATPVVFFRFLGLAPLTLGALVLNEVWQLYHPPLAKSIQFSLRFGERVLRSSTPGLVVFTDPLCPFCRQDEQKIRPSDTPLPIIHRWKILSQHGEPAIRLACAIESALREDRAKGEEFFKLIYSGQNAPQRAETIDDGIKAGFARSQVSNWIDNPDPICLDKISLDGKLADSLGVDSVPRLAVLYAPQGSSSLALYLAGYQDLVGLPRLVGGRYDSFRSLVSGGK